MPFVLRHRLTGEIAACVQRNVYDLDYYGAKWWPTEEDASKEKDRFLAEQARDGANDWLIIKVEDSQLKLFNVKLKNNPRLVLYMDDDGRTDVRPIEAQ